MPIRYPCTENEDGTKNIHDVPVFKLDGEKRGFDFNEEWGDATVNAFNSNKESGFLPPVIRGHNKINQEMPAEGFMDNLRRNGRELVADLKQIPADFFDEIKNRRYPQRSIEVLPKMNQLLAVALLGSSAPHDKLPSLAFQHDDGIRKFTESPDAVWHNEEATLADEDTTTTKGTNVEDTNVVTPEQFAALQAEIETLKGEIATSASELAEAQKIVQAGNDRVRELQVESFSTRVRSLGFTPAFIESAEVAGTRSLFASDAVVKFGEVEHSGLDGLISLFGAIAEMGKNGTLLVPTGETATDENATGVGDGLSLVDKAKKLMSEHEGMKFDVAYKAILKSEEG